MGHPLACTRGLPFREHRTMAEVLECEALAQLNAIRPLRKRLVYLTTRAVLPTPTPAEMARCAPSRPS
jgi:hypothetical protein